MGGSLQDSKSPTGRLGEHSFFPEVQGEIAVGLGNGSRSGRGEAAQGGSAAPGGRDAAHLVTFHGTVWGLRPYRPPFPAQQPCRTGDNGKLGKDDGPTNGSGHLPPWST